VAPAASADSLFYSVQVATFDALPQAMAHADRLRQNGSPAIVTPVRMGGQEGWYRVLAGSLPSPRAADSLRRALWDQRLLESPQGAIMRVHQAYQVGERVPAATAEATARGLRARGIPAYIVGASDGTGRVYVGAFDLPDQARTIDSLLASAGITGTLTPRLGTTQ
jgi:cell division septation protein DedD